MSARQYSECPKCEKLEAQRQQEAKAAADKAYGKVKPDRYGQLVLEALPRKLDDTLAEYFELGIEPGDVFKMHYSCGCQVCGFEFRADWECPVKEAVNHG